MNSIQNCAYFLFFEFYSQKSLNPYSVAISSPKTSFCEIQNDPAIGFLETKLLKNGCSMSQTTWIG